MQNISHLPLTSAFVLTKRAMMTMMETVSRGGFTE